MNYKEIIGYTGTILSVISFIPILLNIVKTKLTNNFPYKTLFLALLANLLFLLNGILSFNKVIIFMGTIFVLIYSYILYIKMTFKKK